MFSVFASFKVSLSQNSKMFESMFFVFVVNLTVSVTFGFSLSSINRPSSLISLCGKPIKSSAFVIRFLLFYSFWSASCFSFKLSMMFLKFFSRPAGLKRLFRGLKTGDLAAFYTNDWDSLNIFWPIFYSGDISRFKDIADVRLDPLDCVCLMIISLEFVLLIFNQNKI